MALFSGTPGVNKIYAFITTKADPWNRAGSEGG